MKRHVALVSLNQFDPFLRDGGSHCLLSRLQFVRDRGNQVSILNFITHDLTHRFFTDGLVDTNGTGIIREGNTCRAVFRGVNYLQEGLPFGFDQQSSHYQEILKIIIRTIQEENVDYVFTADEGYFQLLATYLLKIPGCHLFNSLFNVAMFEKNNAYIHFLKKTVLFANSSFIQDQIKSRLGLHSQIWYPFINFDAYRIWQDGARTNRIGFCSQGKVKGDVIVAEIVRRMPGHFFVVVGKRYGDQGDISPRNLTYLGHIPDMRKFYGQIDLLLVPSLVEEAFPRVILEAAVNGIPVIANRVGGVSEALADSGILIDIDTREPNVAEIAEKYVQEIHRILDNRDVYERYREAAFTRAKDYEIKQTLMAQEIYDKYIQ
jgi:glycosyltransferase involved in cell wall biosynthesis